VPHGAERGGDEAKQVASYTARGRRRLDPVVWFRSVPMGPTKKGMEERSSVEGMERGF
jgi:hypothetical protein